MSGEWHGMPCWFELGTTDLAGAAAFYGALFGWRVADAGAPGMDYRLARDDAGLAAGMMALTGDLAGIPPHWLTYICVDSADATAEAARAAGGHVVRPPADIPGTGRYAVLRDPQGSHFAVLQPAPMDPPPPEGSGAWRPMAPGRGSWLDLMSTDPEAGFAFYAGLFGWTRSRAMPMGEAGAYQLFARKGTEIGGMMGLGDAPVPNWLPYFGAPGRVTDAIGAAERAGGRVHAGPHEVPGPAWIAVMQDPQGVWFALVGAER